MSLYLALRAHRQAEIRHFVRSCGAAAYFIADLIASFKLPERLEVMTAFPVSPVGKILKRELREMVAQRISEVVR